MKKHPFLTLVATVLSFAVMAQELNNSPSIPDTIKVYDITFGIYKHGRTTTYKVNDKVVDEAEFKKLTEGHQQRKNCAPCYIKMYSLKEVLTRSGLYYNNCPGDKTEKSTETINDDGSMHIKIAGGCNHGEWKTYDKKGRVKAVKILNYGEEVSENSGTNNSEEKSN